MLELFVKLENAKCLVIMPCCYHRFEQSNGGFKYFPKCQVLKDLTDELTFVNQAFLRLACQKCGFGHMTDEQHDRHAMNWLFRAILQEVASEGELFIKSL